jgi:hypothetical protein
MRILIEHLPHDVSEDEIREALARFAPVAHISLVKDGDLPAALIEMEMTRAQAEALAARIDGHVHAVGGLSGGPVAPTRLR